MDYFAYGSNMSIARLRARVPSAVSRGCHRLDGHDLRFHKAGADGSAKCDAYFTADPDDAVYGVLFRIDPDDKPALDWAEGLGFAYDQKDVVITAPDGARVEAFTYVAFQIDAAMQPYSWYRNHVLVGAREVSLPQAYIERKILAVAAIEDANRKRDAQQRAIHD